MESAEVRPVAVRGDTSTWVVALDVTAKVVLLLLMARVALDPAWGNLEGKAPGTRALTYPLLALVVPAVFLGRASLGRYPWAADLLVTVPAFSDVLGNRLDLYDRLSWFDDWMHFMNTGLLCAAILILSGASRASLRRRLELGIASGMTLALAWELWEYYAFVTKSAESATAYGDTVGDLTLGWAGAVVAALFVGVSHSATTSHPGALGPGGTHRPTLLDPGGRSDAGDLTEQHRRTSWTGALRARSWSASQVRDGSRQPCGTPQSALSEKGRRSSSCTPSASRRRPRHPAC